MILPWLAGAGVMIGGHHAVSGASAGISGLTKYSNSVPVGLPTNYVAEPVGQPFRYRITVRNPGSDYQLNYFNCVPLPPGLSINTAVGAAGYITGTPTNAGTYVVTLVAGNLNYPIPATAEATLVFYLPNAPPAITSHPQDRSAPVGGNVTFSVTAQGAPPLACQWQLSGTSIPGATNFFLALTNLTSSQAGAYRVIVSNPHGSTTSAVARLTVQEAFVTQVRLSGPVLSNEMCHFRVTGPAQTNVVLWRALNLTNWTPIRTNWTPDGVSVFVEPHVNGLPADFYRASLAP